MTAALTLPKTSNFGVGLKITTNLIVGALPPFVFDDEHTSPLGVFRVMIRGGFRVVFGLIFQWLLEWFLEWFLK